MSLATTATNRTRPSLGLGHAAAVLLVATATGAALIIDAAAQVPNLSLVFVLPVVVCAIVFGAGPALSAAILGVLACNFFLIAPRYTLRVADPSNLLSLALLLAVAVVVSAVAAQARQRTLEAVEARDQAAAVRDLARHLIAERSRDELARLCAGALTRLFQAPACVMLIDDDDLQGARVDGLALGDADFEAARWAAATGLATRGGAYPVGEATFDFWPLKTPLRQQAVAGVAISGSDESRPAEPERLVETVLGYLGLALDREAYAAQAIAGEVLVASEKLKAELLAAVSHDLKTPLATILLSLQSVRQFGAEHDASARDGLLAGAEAEAARLSGMVDDLLNMNRIEAGALSVRCEPCDPADLVDAAVRRAARALDNRVVRNGVEPGGVLHVDRALFETALANVLANAAKYAPASEIELSAHVEDNIAWIEVADRGPGFGGDAESLFEKFARGQTGDGRSPGAGLGLSLARAFLRAMDGEVAARDREGGGAAVRLSAPGQAAA
jgi:two-component system sensor histidine kinase KdpD